ncbi:PhnD/SsuA/transferrin family substrate-binding protein, partial [Halorubrum sp. SD626R]|uniref:PhnD/SsuA/transferrin family substrate-binding protein n=1 Tax=Halorubrum sp. SD626R TaxID=1419722 RepID=UPI0018EEC199
MVDDSGGRTEASSRRRFILAGGAVGIAGLAGCSGGSGGSSGETVGTGGSGGDGGSGDSDESGDPLLAESSAFDAQEPNWEENNYLATPLVDAGYERGGQADLERMGNREVEEVPHGDPVRETPEDESEWLEPDTLVFTESPSEDVQGRYEEDFQAVFDRIEEETGLPVEYNRVNNYAASVEAMRSERAHIANFSTGTTAFAVNLAGAVPFAAGVAPDGAFGYRLFATARADADEIQSVEDFADDDVRMAHAEPASNSGHQAPSA